MQSNRIYLESVNVVTVNSEKDLNGINVFNVYVVVAVAVVGMLVERLCYSIFLNGMGFIQFG